MPTEKFTLVQGDLRLMQFDACDGVNDLQNAALLTAITQQSGGHIMIEQRWSRAVDSNVTLMMLDGEDL